MPKTSWTHALTYAQYLNKLRIYDTWTTPKLECSKSQHNSKFKIYRTKGGKLAIQETLIYPSGALPWEPRYYKTSDGLVKAFLNRAEKLGIDVDQEVKELPLIFRVREFSRALYWAGVSLQNPERVLRSGLILPVRLSVVISTPYSLPRYHPHPIQAIPAHPRPTFQSPTCCSNRA
jgi:hypothetical protein